MQLFSLRCILCAVVFVFSCPALQGYELPTGVYSYRETVGGMITPFYWKVEEQGKKRIVSVYENEKSFINLCSADGATWQWQLKDPDKKHDIIAKRQGNELTLSGVRNGETYEETVELDERPWYQPLSYSLGNFLRSDEKSRSFWMIRADTVEVTTLEVEKKGEEEIFVNQKAVVAQKVVLRPEGFYAHFWHGTYWFRKSDKIFLMYRSVQGLPGTAETVVELMGEPVQLKTM